METYIGRCLLGGKWRYVEVMQVRNGKAVVETYDEDEETLVLPVEDIERAEPIPVDEEKLRLFVRFEIGKSELVPEGIPPRLLARAEPYIITAEDLLSAFKRAKFETLERFRDDWLFPLAYALDDIIRVRPSDASEREAVDSYRFLKTESSFVADILTDAEEWLDGGDEEELPIDGWIAALECVIAMRDQPVPERAYPDAVKLCYLMMFEPEHMLDSASERELALFRQYLEELCAKGEREAIRIKAYACYGGNRAYDCDWFTSRDLLLRLMEFGSEPFTANTLGYIFYYGRCNGGDPEYEKAFYYFSIGAAGGVYESRYKLADMFMNGYGVPKGREIGERIIRELYAENLNHMFAGHTNCKFADIALRMSSLPEEEPFDALKYCLQARFALRMRQMETDYYGDESVAGNIDSALERILSQSGFAYNNHIFRVGCFSEILDGSCALHSTIELKLRRLKNGWSAKLRLLPGSNKMKKFFVTLPTEHFCGYMETLSLHTEDKIRISIDKKRFQGDSAVITFEKAELALDGFFLMQNDRTVAGFGGDGLWTLDIPEPEKEKRYSFASVAFDGREERFDYLCDPDEIKAGDAVLVPWGIMERRANVVRILERRESECVLPIRDYERVLKKL